MSTSSPLRDDPARRAAILDHDRSFLVEAGAGSGKTAVMAGRIAALLAEGTPAHSIAAITFTELAAGELLVRVRDFVAALRNGDVPREIELAFPKGLSGEQRANLEAAEKSIDEITCTTIHGFCQRLITPYPVEAEIDPGATVIDARQADRAFWEALDTWLRQELSEEGGRIIPALVKENPDKTVTLLQTIAQKLRERRALRAPVADPIGPLVDDFKKAAADFAAFLNGCPVTQEITCNASGAFSSMSNALEDPASSAKPEGLVRLLVTSPEQSLLTQGKFRKKPRVKGKWETAAKEAGLSKAEGGILNHEAGEHYDACVAAWEALMAAASAHVMALILKDMEPLMRLFAGRKRKAAQLDFDDLIFATRDLLRDHRSVRDALAARFDKVLVDEFQDTDPLQIEIIWRLCGELREADQEGDWKALQIRPGALFLVGDPKQGIYRFRGADVAAYTQARQAISELDPGNVLSISINFRSLEPILSYVNERFEPVLSAKGQPGFTALDPFFFNEAGEVCVSALDIPIPEKEAKPTVEDRRNAEADAVAEMCIRLIGSETVRDRSTGEKRACRPGDIALLAPSGTDLWRYEEALEQRGIPVAPQAGKGLFRRQEMQDLIALTRTLADGRDTLALGALLRGPLIGFTEEELLDVTWALPRDPETPEQWSRLDLRVDATAIKHPRMARVIRLLQSLYRSASSTTPHALLSKAIDELRLRPILFNRHSGQAERALANVDLFLSFAAEYNTRGLRAFSEWMTEGWTDETRAEEGRPDAQEEAVTLYTIHAAKGLEWPIVMPINTMTGIKSADGCVVDRDTSTIHMPILGVKPVGYECAWDAEKAELSFERIRLWYVAVTRARERLVLPKPSIGAAENAWLSLLDLAIDQLPVQDLSVFSAEATAVGSPAENPQTREVFATEATLITERDRTLHWLAPSRHEVSDSTPSEAEPVELWVSGDLETESGSTLPRVVQGSRERGTILHKLIEEVLTGETEEAPEALIQRAKELIRELGLPMFDDPAEGLAPDELADCVLRALALPEIAERRRTLVPEFQVYQFVEEDGVEKISVGVVDAMGFSGNGTPEVIIDWKSDVEPTEETLNQYRAQVGQYLEITGAEQGLVVLLTTGLVHKVA